MAFAALFQLNDGWQITYQQLPPCCYVYDHLLRVDECDQYKCNSVASVTHSSAVGNHSNASKNHRREDNPDANQWFIQPHSPWLCCNESQIRVGWGNQYVTQSGRDPTDKQQPTTNDETKLPLVSWNRSFCFDQMHHATCITMVLGTVVAKGVKAQAHCAATILLCFVCMKPVCTNRTAED